MPSMEEILGESIELERKVPGTRPGESEKVRYISFQEPRTPDDIFEEVPWILEPLLPKCGGVVLAGCILTLPDGLRFCALSFHKDVEGWQRQIEEGTRMLGLVSARLEDEVMHLSDGRSIPLRDCKVEFD
ncbi:hypothetical protein MPPM_1342 [Methylorubrum populi]|uniref:Uncharacterized protein n=1 Tax=Methylorubrum populi TaxID=223967 RepID=A0A160PAZ6_9HYPH|nr:hypothetical protein [Methylorubrum populi]BAU89947.1 hypothetical protein MPPM_1342 [Methylorubrum populi]